MGIRTVTSWTDVNNALREIYDFMDRWRGKTIDLGGRQIKNAGLSKDDRDYVCRAELIDTKGGIAPKQKKQKPASSVATYDKVTFGIGVKKDVETGDDLTPPYIWTNLRDSDGPPELVAIAANIPPGGADLIVDIKLKRPNSIWAAGTTIFTGAATATNPHGYPFIPDTNGIILPNGDNVSGMAKYAYVYTDIFLPKNILTGFKRKDIISISCLQAGQVVKGQDIEVVLYCPLS